MHISTSENLQETWQKLIWANKKQAAYETGNDYKIISIYYFE